MTSAWKFSNLHYCSICCKHFVDPRILPCGHTYCLACLTSQSDNAEDSPSISRVACPECREQFPLPEDGIANLPKNVFVAALANPLVSAKYGNSDFCAVHANRKRDQYCQSCNEALCDLCVYCGHAGHPCQPLRLVADKLRQRLSAVATNIDAELAKCQSFVKSIKDNQARFVSNQEELRHRVVDTAKSVEMMIEQHRVDIVEKIDACKRMQNESVRLVKSRAEDLRGDLERVLAEVNSNADYCSEMDLVRNYASVKASVDGVGVKSDELGCFASQLRFVRLHLVPNERYAAAATGGSCCLIGTIEASTDNDDTAVGSGKSDACISSSCEHDVSSLVEKSPDLYIPELPAPVPIYIPDPPSPHADVEQSPQLAYGRAAHQHFTGIYSQAGSSPTIPFESIQPVVVTGQQNYLSSVTCDASPVPSSPSNGPVVGCLTLKPADKSCRGRGRNVGDVKLPLSASSIDGTSMTIYDTARAENFSFFWTDTSNSDMSTKATGGQSLRSGSDPPPMQSAEACGTSRSPNSPCDAAAISVPEAAVVPLFSPPESSGVSGYRVRDSLKQSQTVNRSCGVGYRGRLLPSSTKAIVPSFEDGVGSAKPGACEAVEVVGGGAVGDVVDVLPSGCNVRRLGTIISSNSEDFAWKRMQFGYQPVSPSNALPKDDVGSAVETSLFQYVAPPPQCSFQMCAPESPRSADVVPANSYRCDLSGNLDRASINAEDIMSSRPLSVQPPVASKPDYVDFLSVVGSSAFKLTDSSASPPERRLHTRTFHRMMVANKLPPLQESDDHLASDGSSSVVTSLANNMASGHELSGEVSANELSRKPFQTVHNESVDATGGGGDGPTLIERDLTVCSTANLSSLSAEFSPPDGIQTRATSRATTLAYFPSAENDNSLPVYAADSPRRAQGVDDVQQTAESARKCDKNSPVKPAFRLASDDNDDNVKSGQFSAHDQLPTATELVSDELNGESKNNMTFDDASSAARGVTRSNWKRSGRQYFPELREWTEADDGNVGGGGRDLGAQSVASRELRSSPAGACFSEKTDVLQSTSITTELPPEYSAIAVQHHRHLKPQLGEESRDISPRPAAAAESSSVLRVSPEKRPVLPAYDRAMSTTAASCAAGQDSPPKRQRDATSGFAANILRRLLYSSSKSPDVQTSVSTAATKTCDRPGEAEMVLMADTMSDVSTGRSEIADDLGVSPDAIVDKREVDLSGISGAAAVTTECSLSADVVSSSDPSLPSATPSIAATLISETGSNVAACSILSVQPMADTPSHRKCSPIEDVKNADSAIISLALIDENLDSAKQIPATSTTVSSSVTFPTATGSSSRQTVEQVRVGACGVAALQPVPSSSVGSPRRKSHQVKQSSCANLQCDSSRANSRDISAKSVTVATGDNKSQGSKSHNMAQRRGGDKNVRSKEECNKNAAITAQRQAEGVHVGRSQLKWRRPPYHKEERGEPRKQADHDRDRVAWRKMKTFGENKMPQRSADSSSRVKSSSSGATETTPNDAASSIPAEGPSKTVPVGVGRDSDRRAAANGNAAASQTQCSDSRKLAQPRSSHGKQSSL